MLKTVEKFKPKALFTLPSDDVSSGRNQIIQLVCTRERR